MKKAVCTRSITIRLNRLIEQYLIVATGNKHDSSRTYELKKLVAAWHDHVKLVVAILFMLNGSLLKLRSQQLVNE